MSDLPHELEAAIVAHPDEAAPYLVAADWLQARGDPHGELIALMRGLESEQSPASFLAKKQRREALLREHSEAWLGGAELDVAQWRWGFVSHARVEVEHVAPFLASRAGRFVRSLEIHGPLEGLEEALRAAPPRALTGLALVGGPRRPPLRLARVLESLALKKLGIVALEADFTGFSGRTLESLRIRDVQHPTLTGFLGQVDTSHLEELELCVDAPLVFKTSVAARAPKLAQLALEDDLADELAAWAARTSVIRHLETLSLCGPMTDRGLDALLVEAARLSRLTRLRLEGGHFSGGLKRLAYRQLPTLTFERSRAPWAFFPPSPR